MKRWMMLLLAVVLCFGVLTVEAEAAEVSGKCGENLTWTYDEELHKLTISGDGDMYSWDAYEDAPWYSLDYALVEITWGTRSIGSYAFGYDSHGLGEYTVPYFEIPWSVARIENNAFHGNAAKLMFAQKPPEFDEAAFAGAGQITVVHYDWYEWDDLVHNHYGADSVDWCRIEHSSGTYEGDAGWETEWYDGVWTITLFGTEMPNIFPMLPEWNLYYSGTIDIAQVEEGVPGVEASSFENCYSLRTVVLSESVREIGATAFRNCYSLKELVLPKGITQIGSGAFYGCENLKDIRFEGSAPAFDEYAFQGNVLTARYPAGDPSWSEAVLQNYGGTVNWVPYSDNSCGEYVTWSYDEATKTLTISGTGDMDDWNYAAAPEPEKRPSWEIHKDDIQKVVIEDGVTSIGEYAFHNYGSITEITIAETVTRIGRDAFYYCTNLKSVPLPQGLTSISDLMLAGCKNLTEVDIPDGVTAIGAGAFRYCTGLTSLDIPAGVTSIGSETFRGCANLQDVVLPKGLTVISDGLFWGCSALKEIVIPDAVTAIGHNAFKKCSGISSIVIPAKVASVGNWAFEACTALKTVEFKGDAPEFLKAVDYDEFGEEFMAANRAFKGVTATVIYPAGNATWTKEVRQNYGGTITWKEKKLEAPQIKASNASDSGKPKLTWQAVEGAVKYEIWRSTKQNSGFQKIYTQKGTVYTNKSAKPGVKYYYKVKSVGANGKVTGFSNRVGRMCDLARPVVKISNVAASGKLRLKWEKIDGAVKYQIYRATAENGKYSLMKTVTGNVYTNTNAKAGTKYFYKVIAVHENTNANSAYSAVVSRMADLARPEITVKLNAAGKSRISWKKVEGAVKYEVWRATSQNGKYTKLVTTKNLYQVNKNAVAGKTYYYKVMAVHSNTNANSAFSLPKYIKAK